MVGITMAKMNKNYMAFYFDGRDDELETDDVDIEDLADKCMAGPDDVHTVLLAAMTTLAAPLEHDREKRTWISENKEVIDEAGGDAEEAYRHYCKGRIDEAVCAIEPEVLEQMDPRDEEEDDEVGDGDDEDEDEENDDNEGDD